MNLFLYLFREFKKQRSSIKRKLEFIHKLEKKGKKDGVTNNRAEMDKISGIGTTREYKFYMAVCFWYLVKWDLSSVR